MKAAELCSLNYNAVLFIMLLGKLRTLSYATWLFALERDSTLSSHSKQSFWFQIFHRIRKNKMANGKTKRVGHFHVGPLVLRGLKVAARITFLGANVAGAA